MSLPRPNPQFKYGYKYGASAYREDSICLMIRNGKKMLGLFIEPEDALKLSEELRASVEELNENKAG